MNELTSKDFWKKRWDKTSLASKVERSVFHDLFEKLLPKGGQKYLELGCTPGTNLAYFYHYFGYQVSGLDYASLEKTRENLNGLGVSNYQLFNMDFNKELPSEKFDIVGSFGLIEHFDDISPVLEKHLALLESGGLLIVGIPHFRYFQYWLRLIFDRDAMDYHNLAIMKPTLLKSSLEDLGVSEIVYANYVKTFRFWIDNENINPLLRKAIYMAQAVILRLLKWLRLDNVPNRFFSPYILVIARK